jgi:UDP-N-acetylmuramoyl-L-alanyl-D-glutamate--2,6-diaminopimelate ligase
MAKRLTAWLRRRLRQEHINYLHLLRAVWANLRYGFPARGMLVFGVTGTKGKTTTCHFLASILEEAGYTVGMVTTVSFKIGEDIQMNDTNKSNVQPAQLQQLLRRMRDARCDAVILEATSIGLDQYRLWGIPFRYVGFTNLAHDHLDYHHNWEGYQQAKFRLFRRRGLRASAFNTDDPTGVLFLEKTTAKRKWSYSTVSPQPAAGATDHLFADRLSTNMQGSTFTLVAEQEQARVRLPLPGRFSVENALCAAALSLNLNLRLGTVVRGLEQAGRVPGRLERIDTKKGFSITIDYAHTPDSLEKLYATMRPEIRGRMIAVLGSCGDRDKTKRPIMGALAARFCDYVIVTDEEPYTEDPQAIIDEVAKGVPRGRALYKPSGTVAQKQPRTVFRKGNENGEGDWWWKVADRREAIAMAIDLCKMDDLVLVTGMGSQNFKIVGNRRVPWNDRQVVEELLREKNLI